MKEIYICMCSHGDYDDCQEESFMAYISKAVAEDVMQKVIAELNKLEMPDFPADLDAPDSAWDKARGARGKVEKKIAGIFKAVDWECSDTPDDYMDAKFYVLALELRE